MKGKDITKKTTGKNRMKGKEERNAFIIFISYLLIDFQWRKGCGRDWMVYISF